jgi:hypothetical protein
MSRSRASRLSARAALVAALLITSVIPTSAAYNVAFTTSSSPFVVTAGLPVAYPVTVMNSGGNILNHVTVTGAIVDSSGAPATNFTFRPDLTVPADACSDTEPRCDFDQIRPGQATPQVIFYYIAPTTVNNPNGAVGDTYTFNALARVSQGPNDDQNPGNSDSFLSQNVVTKVVTVSPDLVAGHSVPGIRTFSTGLTNLGTTNKHGTEVTVPITAEVTLKDLLDPNDPLGKCSGLTGGVSFPCFGQASYFAIAGGTLVPGGFKAKVRWDYSDLPSGMSEKKIHLVHLFTPGNTYELITAQCNSPTAPTNVPCLVGPPVREADKDISATFFLNSGSTVRGW